MAFSFLKRLFGAEAQEGGSLPPLVEGAPPPEVPATDENGAASAPASSLEALQNFVRFLVCSLVDHPEQVTLTIAEKRDLTIIQIHCVKKDIGKVIGKSGKTISALRTLISNASAHTRQRVTVDVMDE
ncbi:MAG: KH domain-containing protein [Victivallales bacterium]|nr:KH domain-containing protein [Victivallales bacterium]